MESYNMNSFVPGFFVQHYICEIHLCFWCGSSFSSCYILFLCRNTRQCIRPSVDGYFGVVKSTAMCIPTLDVCRTGLVSLSR